MYCTLGGFQNCPKPDTLSDSEWWAQSRLVYSRVKMPLLLMLYFLRAVARHYMCSNVQVCLASYISQILLWNKCHQGSVVWIPRWHVELLLVLAAACHTNSEPRAYCNLIVLRLNIWKDINFCRHMHDRHVYFCRDDGYCTYDTHPKHAGALNELVWGIIKAFVC